MDRLQISLSNVDICKLLDNKCNIVVYPDLKNYKSIEELLKPYGYAVILYLSKPNYGHWTAVFYAGPKTNGKKTIEVFDSYGIGIDAEQDFPMDPKFKKKSGMDIPYLTMLLMEAYHKYNMIINEHPFQKKGKIATCGRHVIVRLWNRHLMLDDYANMIFGFGVDPDILVTAMTDKYLPK